MGIIKGTIELKDNMTAVLRNVKQEQSAFRSDVEKTKKELKETWDKKRQAKLDATAATKAMDSMKKKLEPLRKKVTTAVAIKDMATAKVKSVTNKVKAVGKMVAKPVVNVVVKGAQALSAVGKGIAQAGKVAAIGFGAVAAAGGLALNAVFSGSEELASGTMESTAKLGQVMRNTMDATQEQIQSIVDLANAQEGIGVIAGGTTIEGMQELGTYIEEVESLKDLMPVMNDMLAQQYGLGATGENAVNIATMMGKVLNGQTSALSRLGYSFSEAQEHVLKYGTEAEKVATLADVINESVGGMNAALADTELGKIQQMENAMNSVKSEVGDVVISLKAKLAGVLQKNLPTIRTLGETLTGAITKVADVALPVLDKALTQLGPMITTAMDGIGRMAEQIGPVLSGLFDGFSKSAADIKPVLSGIIKGFKPMLPVLSQFGTSVMGTIQKVSTAAMPAIASIINTVQAVIPSVLPVLETVITTIGNVISAAAPIIAGMVEGIGTVVSTLAPVFDTIFSSIGDKVGTVIDFVGSKMGFIQDVIGTAAPLISDILSTAWSVMSPVLDLAINVFKIIFNVVQKVFPGIQKILQTVWGIIKPIVEGVGWVVSNIAGAFGWIADKLGGGGGSEAGTNAEGTNNWRGGPTWVGERGPELVDLPGGTRILPNKESVQFARGSGQSVVQTQAVRETVLAAGGGQGSVVVQAVMERIQQSVAAIVDLITRRSRDEEQGVSLPESILQALTRKEAPLEVPRTAGGSSKAEKILRSLTVTIAKLADTIIIREEADIDKLGEAITKKVVLAVQNMA